MMGKRIVVDVPLLFRLWADQTVYSADLPRLLNVSETSIRRLAVQYGLPRRKPYVKDRAVDLGPLPTDPTPSQIAERARECRERHYAIRRAESEEGLRSKLHRWDRGEHLPQGAHHERA